MVANKSIYDSFLKDILEKEYRWYDLYEEASKLLPPPDSRTIVDLGCGVGGFAKLLFKKGYKNFLGIDISTYGIQVCKKRVPSFTFLVRDILSKSILKKLRGYSIFTILEVLEHIKRDLDLLSSIPSKSIVVFSVPNRDHSSHVRFFNNTDEVIERYKKVVKFNHTVTVDKRGKPGQKMFLFKTVRF